MASTRPRRCATKPRGATGAPCGPGGFGSSLGTADRTGLPDASVDRVVSVNNVAIWPDLEAAVGELHRVVRPGGTVVIAWHGGTKPSRVARSLRLPEDELGRIEHVLRDRFAEVSRRQLASLDVFKWPFARGESGSTGLVTV